MAGTGSSGPPAQRAPRRGRAAPRLGVGQPGGQPPTQGARAAPRSRTTSGPPAAARAAAPARAAERATASAGSRSASQSALNRAALTCAAAAVQGRAEGGGQRARGRPARGGPAAGRGPPAQPPAQLRLGQPAPQRGRERRRVGRGDQQAGPAPPGAAERLRHAADVGGDHRDAAGERLGDHHPVRLGPRRQDEQVGRRRTRRRAPPRSSGPAKSGTSGRARPARPAIAGARSQRRPADARPRQVPSLASASTQHVVALARSDRRDAEQPVAGRAAHGGGAGSTPGGATCTRRGAPRAIRDPARRRRAGGDHVGRGRAASGVPARPAGRDVSRQARLVGQRQVHQHDQPQPARRAGSSTSGTAHATSPSSSTVSPSGIRPAPRRARRRRSRRAARPGDRDLVHVPGPRRGRRTPAARSVLPPLGVPGSSTPPRQHHGRRVS